MTEPAAAFYRDRTSKELGLAGNHYDAIQAHLDDYEKAVARELAERQRALIGRCPCDCISTVTELIDPNGSSR